MHTLKSSLKGKKRPSCVCVHRSQLSGCGRELFRTVFIDGNVQDRKELDQSVSWRMDFPNKKMGDTIFGHLYLQRYRPSLSSLCPLLRLPPLEIWALRFLPFVSHWKINKAIFKGLLCTLRRLR